MFLSHQSHLALSKDYSSNTNCQAIELYQLPSIKRLQLQIWCEAISTKLVIRHARFPSCKFSQPSLDGPNLEQVRNLHNLRLCTDASRGPSIPSMSASVYQILQLRVVRIPLRG